MPNADGGSPKYIFALESHLKGGTPQQGWGCRVVLLHATASLVGKQTKGLDFQKYLNFLDFFSPLEERLLFWNMTRYVWVLQCRKKIYDTEIFNYSFIST